MLNNTHIRSYVYVILFLLFTALDTAIAQLVNVKQFNTETVLNQKYIYQFSQLPNRSMVMSTNEGLVTYDGNKFTNYTTKNGLSNDFVTCHAIDKQSNIWLGHYQNGVSLVTNKSVVKKLLNTELITTKVTGIYVHYTTATNYIVYVCTMGKGMYTLNNLGQTIKHNTTESAITTSELSNNQLFIASELGITITNVTNNKTLYTTDSITGNEVTASCYTHGNWYVALKNNTICKLEKNTLKKIYQYPNTEGKLVQLLPFNNQLLINTFNNGVLALDITTHLTSNYYTKYYGLNSVLLQSLFVDDENNVWLGSYGSGAIQLLRQQFTNYTATNNSILKNVTAIVKNENDKSIFVAANTTLLHYDEGITTLKNKVELHDKITCLTQQHDTLWIGTENKGVYLYSTTTHSLISFNALHALPLQQINAIKQYGKHIYIATNNGLHVYNIYTKNIKTFTTNEGLLHNNIYSVCADKLGRIWFAAHGAGIFYLKDNEFVAFKDVAGLNLFNINSISVDDYNTVWIATEGDGVFKYERNNFTNYRTSNGLLSNYCYGITTDSKGGVWVMNRNGLSYKKNNQKYFTGLQTSDGILINNFNLNAILNYENEELFFGGENGMLYYSLKKSKLLFKTPTLQLYNVLINGTPTAIVNNTIQLPYGKYDVVINYNATTFLQHEKVRYKYMLKGLETKWNENITTSFSYYPHLTDGNYTYELYATNADGFKTTTPITLTLIIDKPFYKKWWTYLLLVLTIVGSIQLFVRYKLKKLTGERAKLQLLIEKRTGQLRNEKNNLEIAKQQIEIINKDMTDSINYAKLIQEAILPKYEKIKQSFPNYFVFYEPRDIVSGDFYFHTRKFNKTIFIVGDCTGHGVPGGFMSMISNTLINKIINDITHDTINPAQIISELQYNIVQELNQQDTETSSRDGLDLAICIIDETTHTLHISGAGRPVYYVSNNKLTEYKGSVFGVGGYDAGVKKEYPYYTVNYTSGDFVYLCSDGYADQFGGLDKRKFMSKRLKALFETNAHLPATQQQKIVTDTFYNWKGTLKQIDDIIVLGLGL